jgi:hypothetical protein
MSSFPPIDLATLVTVTGGADGDPPGAPNTDSTKANGNIGVTYKGTQVGVQGGYESTSTKTNPAQCASDVRAAGGTAADVLKCYQPQSK